jgi:type III pantothenate kinase
MLLTIDIGNTNITLGIFEGGQLMDHWRLASDTARMPDEYGLQLLGLFRSNALRPEELSGVALASVVPPLTSKIQEACQDYLSKSPIIIESQHCAPIINRYEPPQAVGIDRLVDAVAAEKKYGLPACIVDFGTATTFDAIDRNYNYLGGAITPGVGVSLDALVSHTAKLPKVELQLPEHVLGRNTTQAMQSGLLWGYISMVEGMVTRFRAELGEDVKVIATGGLAQLIGLHTASIDVIDPWLTLEGLYFIWERMRP